MGSPIHATPADRLATRSLASAVLEAIREDEAMPLPIGAANAGRVNQWLVYDKRDAESLIAQLCGEIVALVAERDRAMHIVEAVAWAEPNDCIGHLKVYPNDGADTFPDGERAKYLGECANELMGKAVTVCRNKEQP